MAQQRCIASNHVIDPERPRVIFAAKTFRGSNVLCWNCFINDYLEHDCINLAEWLPDYIKRHTDPAIVLKRENEELRLKVERLQKQLDDEKKLNSGGRYK